MGIFMTEELSDEERAELEALQIEIMTPVITEEEQEEVPEGEEGENQTDESGQESPEDGEGEENIPNEVWKSFPIDPATGYAIDPDTGNYVDPETGATLGGTYEGGASTETPDTGEEPEEEEE